jgi:hypothetical protein
MGVYILNEYSFEAINSYNGTRTPSGEVKYDLTTAYFWRSLYQRALSNFIFDLPESWNKGYFKNILFGLGYIGIVKTPQFGIIPQLCTLTGYGLYLQPTTVLVAQPLVNFEGTIGDNCEVIKLSPDYSGILDIIDHYADKLATCWTSVNVSLINSRAGLIALPKNKNAAEAIKYIAERLSAGETLVCGDKVLKEDIEGNDPIVTYFSDPAKNYITDKLLSDFTSILNSFDREIGIPVIDEKKERRIQSEVSAIISDSGTRIDTWKESLDDSIKRVNDLFGLNISYKVRGEENVNYATNDDRTL